jgi:hypothetical protein
LENEEFKNRALRRIIERWMQEVTDAWRGSIMRSLRRKKLV